MTARPAASLATLLVDDEPLALNELQFLLRDFAEIEVVGTASNGPQAVEAVAGLDPDLVFLDVQMPGLDGLGVIRTLREKSDELPYFVLTTAFDQYAVEAFQLEAMDYLLKPVEKTRLAQTIDRARRVIEDRLRAAEPASIPRTGPARTKIVVRCGARNLIVDAQDIVFVSIEDGMISVVTPEFEGVASYRTIEEMQADLDPDLFWRAHRSYLVNVNRIREVVPWFKSSYQVKMDDKKQTLVPVSRVQTKRLRMLFKL